MFKNSALFKLYENLDFSNGLSIFFVGISLLVNLCVVIIFLAIFIDFIETGSKKKIKLERKNLVATFSMTLFFILMYLFIRFNIGHFALQNFISNFLLLIFGTLLIIIGTIFNILGRIQLGKNWSNQIRVYEDHTLVASGVYAIIRHPLYASLIWMFFGAGLIYRNYLVLICNTLFFIPAMYYRAKKEEQILAKHFFEYINYSHNVPMFFPKIEKILNLKNVSYIDKNGIKFSRGVSVLLLAIAIVFKIKILVIIVLLLKLISVIFSIKYAIFLIIYDFFINSFFAGKKEKIDLSAIRFAQSLGVLLLLLALINFYYFENISAGWLIVFIVAISTSFGIFGHCIGARIYYWIRNTF